MRQRIDALSAPKRRLLAQLLSDRPDVAAVSVDGVRDLVAYVVADPGAEITPERAREGLIATLPDYMVPAHVVLMEELPLSPNGKVDRGALPDPGAQSEPGDADHVEPQTDAQRALAQIWSDVLNMQDLSIHDNFFELGGHSLLVNQVVSRVSVAFAIELPLRAVFEAPTIAELAVLVEQAVIADLTGASVDAQ